MYYVLLRSMEERTRLINKLAEHGIKAVFHYSPLHSSPAGMRFGRSAGAMPHTDRTSDTLLRLPLYYDLGEEGCREVLLSLIHISRKLWGMSIMKWLVACRWCCSATRTFRI